MKENNKINAYKYFAKHTKLKNFVLHHIDVSLKKNDPKRYNEWRIEDLVPMTVKDHCALHMRLRHQSKILKRTQSWNKHVSAAMRSRSMYVQAGLTFKLINKNGHELKRVFQSPVDIAKYLSCSKQSVYRVLGDKYYNKTIFGYAIKTLANVKKEVAA